MGESESDGDLMVRSIVLELLDWCLKSKEQGCRKLIFAESMSRYAMNAPQEQEQSGYNACS